MVVKDLSIVSIMGELVRWGGDLGANGVLELTKSNVLGNK